MGGIKHVYVIKKYIVKGVRNLKEHIKIFVPNEGYDDKSSKIVDGIAVGNGEDLQRR